ncbi:putative fatty acid elongase [Monocercomonoides exilis]|uniref:putative fatty acid elongase n=1 Tax=Monocercomonoides exilis TaxID=2049356 RepID=UPI00355A10F8|nr:putative fatty acid elongase [Monocercomonoides exilis]
MEQTVAQQSYWHSTKDFHLIVGSTFGTQWWFIGFSIVGYLLSLNLLSKYMQKRQALKLKTVASIHNFFLSGLSLVTALGILYELMYGPCPESEQTNRLMKFLFQKRGTPLVGRIYWWCYVYLLSKWYELIDTWIIILRKAQKGVTYLHVLHHSGMLMMVTSWFAANFGALWLPAFLNSLVHVVMYLYYGCATLGIRWRLRNYITIIQLIQFFIGIVYFAIFIPGRMFFGLNASGNLLMMILNSVADAYFFYLFYDFYQQSYKNKKKAHDLENEKKSLEEGKNSDVINKEINNYNLSLTSPSSSYLSSSGFSVSNSASSQADSYLLKTSTTENSAFNMTAVLPNPMSPIKVPMSS